MDTATVMETTIEPTKKESPLSNVTSMAWSILSVNVFHTLTSAGIIFGYPALSQALINKGQFHNLCHESGTCDAQAAMFGNIYTTGNAAFYVGSYILGYVLDRFGPRAANLIGSLCLCAGVAFTAFSDSQKFNGYWIGMILIGFGSTGPYLANFHLANLLPEQYFSTFQITIVNAFNCSALLFLLFAQLIDMGFNRAAILGVYAIWLLVCSFQASVTHPPHMYSRGDNAKLDFSLYTSVWNCLLFRGSKDTASKMEYQTVEMTAKSDANIESGENSNSEEVTIVLADSSAVSDLSSLEVQSADVIDKRNAAGFHDFNKYPEANEAYKDLRFYALMTFMICNIFRFSFYTSSIIIRMGKYGAASTFYVFIMFLILPLGIVFQPLIDLCIEKFGLEGALTVSNILGLCYGVTMMIPNLELQIFTFILFSCHRAFLFSAFYPLVLKLFSFPLFGQLTGILSLSFAPAALIVILVITFMKDFFPLDIIVFPILPVPLFFLTYYLYKYKNV